MSKDVESKLTVLKERLDDGDYRVDTKQVADAILHRPGGKALCALLSARCASTPQRPTAN